MSKEVLGLWLRDVHDLMVDPQAERNPREVDGD
jgi:hypothetical protein